MGFNTTPFLLISFTLDQSLWLCRKLMVAAEWFFPSELQRQVQVAADNLHDEVEPNKSLAHFGSISENNLLKAVNPLYF